MYELLKKYIYIEFKIVFRYHFACLFVCLLPFFSFHSKRDYKGHGEIYIEKCKLKLKFITLCVSVSFRLLFMFSARRVTKQKLKWLIFSYLELKIDFGKFPRKLMMHAKKKNIFSLFWKTLNFFVVATLWHRS